MVETKDVRRSLGSGSQTRASLQLELRVPDRHMLAAIRDAVLRWLDDRTGPLARAIGFGNRISVDEQPPISDAHGMSTLRLTVSWQVAKSRARVKVPRPVDVRIEAPHQEPGPSFVFVPHSSLDDAPLHAYFPDEMEEPIEQPSVQPYPRLSRRPRATALAARVRIRIAAATAFAYQLLQASLRGLQREHLTFRVPALASNARVRSVGLLGSTALATSFLVGSVYLETSGRSTNPAVSPLSQIVSTTGMQAVAPAAVVAVEPTAPAPGVDSAMPATAPPPESPTRPARTKPQSIDRTAPASERSQRARREAASTARAARSPEVAPQVATSGFSVPGDEVITSAPLSERGRERSASSRASQSAVRPTDNTPLPSSAASAGRSTGTLLVKSDPQGAEVSINGVVQGRTPLVIRALGVGSRVVRLELAGYERWSWAVAVVANKSTPLNVKLRPESVGKPD